MDQGVAKTGGCQCGAVRYRADRLEDDAHLCHCRMCQKAVGNAFAALVGVKRDALSWTRGTAARFRSSEFVDRGFCAACGTPLFYEDVRSDGLALTIGSLDAPGAVPPRRNDGTEGRLGWVDAIATLPDHGPSDQPGQQDWAAAIAASSRQHPDHDR